MARAVWMAVAFMLAAAVVEANQCSTSTECPSRNTAQNIVSLLQTKLHKNVLEDGQRIASQQDGHQNQAHLSLGRTIKMSHGMADEGTLIKRIQDMALLDGLWSSAGSETRILSYMSALYHENLEDKPEWRQRWNETEMLYSGIGLLEAHDFPPSLRPIWTYKKKGQYIPINVKKHFALSDTWVEVIREARWDHGEGTDWAGGSCWFFQLKGSGVFINTGRTASFDGDNVFANEQMLSEMPAALQRKANRSEGTGTWSVMDGEDNILTEYAHANGLDTIQTSYSKRSDGNLPELIHFGGPCRDTSILGGCIPGLEFRTGLHANLPCICKETGILNCDGSPAPAPAP